MLTISCLYPTYVRGEAHLAAAEGKEAAAEFQKILDHNGMVWNCWTGSAGNARLRPRIPIYKQAKAEHAKQQLRRFPDIAVAASYHLRVYSDVKAKLAWPKLYTCSDRIPISAKQ